MQNVLIPFQIQTLYPIPSCIISVLNSNTIIISFSVRVINFELSHIQIEGGTLSSFVGNGMDFCVNVITDGTAEIYVLSNVVVSDNNQPNLASNRLIYHG